MPKSHDKITKSVNYDYYWDILFCTVPLLAVSCFYYGARPLLMMAAGLLTAYVADCVVTPLHAAGYRAHEPSSEAMEKKGTPASPATARASRVLPVPGGPTSRTPLGILAPISS